MIDDPQLRHLLGDPFALRIEARYAFAGIRVLDVAKAVPDQTADIQLVVQDSGPASPVAVDRARSPASAGRAGNALGVKLVRNGAAGMADSVFLEDPPDDCGLGINDLPVAADRLAVLVDALDDVIAITKPAAGFARFDPSPKAAPRLVGEILEKKRVHRALEADMEVRDLAL